LYSVNLSHWHKLLGFSACGVKVTFSPTQQNSPQNLERLSAQRFLYSNAKGWIVFQYISVTVLSLAGIAGAFKFGFRVTIASFILVLVDKFILERFIRGRLKEAALIQENFDCDVLSLEWSKTKCGSNIQMEEVHSFAKKMSGSIASQKLKDWYPKAAFSLAPHIGRIICQRANVVWNLSGRKKIALGLNIIFVSTVAVLFLSLFVTDLEAQTWSYAVLIPALPFLSRLWDVWFRVNDSVARMSQLQSRIHEIWNEAISGNNTETKVTERSREFQNELFDFRSREIPVFDKLYWKLRNENEKGMKQTAESFAEAAFDKIQPELANK